MYTKIDKIVYEELEKKKSCNNCQDKPFCEMSNSLQEHACRNWHPEIREYEEKWETIESLLKKEKK